MKFSNFNVRLLNRFYKSLLWKILSSKTAKMGIKQSVLILSFDCDTEEDIDVVWDVHSKLVDVGILPVYAVPGALLKKGERVYAKIKETGSEFINHGGREHTYFNVEKNRHASCFFYDQQHLNLLKEDIHLGHTILNDVLGITANGWRTPHFGTFQNQNHLNFLYSTLEKLDYKFSTSTSPMMAYHYGPLFKNNGIIEIPVTGIYSEPLNIMDTWAYFAAPNRTMTPEDYLIACKSLSKFTKHSPVVINIYGDPSHIHNQPEFFDAMHHLKQNAENLNYNQLLEKINGNIRYL